MDVNTLNTILEHFKIRYKVVKEIKKSGQRTVFLAKDKENFQQKFVLKISSATATAMARIQREIKILQNINSKYYPKIYESFFFTKENIEVLVSKKGEKNFTELANIQKKPVFFTIEEYIENIPWDNCFIPPISQKILVNLLFQIFTAVSILWENKIVHRDLKPDNILIKSDLTPVIIDLGIAKSLRKDTQDLTLPFFATPCTLRYASLEQLKNLKEEINYKCDQFSIGVIAFFMLTGEFPYGDERVEGVDRVLENMESGKIKEINISINHGVNQSLIDFVNKLLSVEPYKRFRNSKIIFEHLNKIQEEIL